MRRSRRRLNPAPILWLLFFASTGAGLWLSPVTSIRKIRIEGAQERGPLVAHAQRLKDVPALRLNPREFEYALLQDDSLDSADFRRSLFGSASLAVRHKTPIAKIEGPQNLYLSSQGVLFRQNVQRLDLPTLELHPSSKSPAVAAVGSWPSRETAKLIQGLSENFDKKGLRIQVDSEGAVCLNTTQAARIFMGGAERLDEKLRALEGLLREKPGLLSTIRELNLTDPARPMIKPKPGQKP